jgi:glycosyltransferase involved in cell wall biosynthesis
VPRVPIQADGPGSRLSVGVIIPTLGRPSVIDAIRSALDQTYAPAQVVVVADGPLALLDAIQRPTDPRVRLLSNRPQTGAAAARNVGVAALSTVLVALLDDDDTWLPEKLERQVAAFQRLRSEGVLHPVIACRSVKTDLSSGRSVVAPRYLIRPGQRPGNYLFRRRQIRPYGAALGHSMLLFERALAIREPFNVNLRRHDDWDWVLRVGALAGVGFEHVEDVLLRYAVHSGSTSAGPGWEVSIRWALGHDRYLSRREQADFLLCVSGPIAVSHKDWRGLAAVLRQVIRLRRGSPSAWAFLTLAVGRSVARRPRGLGVG